MAEYIEKFTVVNRLIDLENEFQHYKPFYGFEHAMYRKICEAEIAIGKTPAADVAPVRHGHWDTGYFHDRVCSCCLHPDNDINDYAHSYCPNCGAKMDEPVGNSDRLEDDK